MKIKKKKYSVKGIWHPFDRFDYCYAWHKKHIIGIIRIFLRDLKYGWQRIVRGYCNMDVWGLSSWFLSLMPVMLQQFRDTHVGSPASLGENYVNSEGIWVNDKCHEEWDKILDKMIYLFREANEETCERKNPYDDEHSRITEEFTKNYGLFGRKLETEQQKAEANLTGAHTIHFPDEIDEYTDTCKKWLEEEKAIDQYREESKNAAFELFVKWFDSLWD